TAKLRTNLRRNHALKLSPKAYCVIAPNEPLARRSAVLPKSSAATLMHSRQRAGASSLAVIRAIWSRHQCVAGRLAGSSPVTIVAPSSKVKDGNIALHVWTFPQKSGAASQRLLIVRVSGAASLFLSAVEPMPSTAKRSAPRPPREILQQNQGSKNVLIGPNDYPINVIGGYKFPLAPPCPDGVP